MKDQLNFKEILIGNESSSKENAQCETPLFVVCQGRILRVTGSFRETFAKTEESPEDSGFTLRIAYSRVTIMFHINFQVS